LRKEEEEEGKGELRHRSRRRSRRRGMGMVEANPFTNAVKIQEKLQLPVTSRMARKRLHADGIHHRTPAIK